MTADYSLKCYDETYNRIMVLAIAVVVLFSLGIPIAIGLILWMRRNQLEEPATKKVLGMLYKSYKPEAYWYEAVQMLFKLGFWASYSFFKDDLQIKLAVAGFGHAEKDEVQEAVMRELNLEEPPRPDDAADALAVALTAWLQR